MTDLQPFDIEPEEPSQGPPAEQAKPAVGKRPFAKLGRELSEDELGSPGLYKLLLGTIDELGETCAVLKQFETKFHDCDKKVAVFEEKFKTKISIEIIHTGCITIGAAALGYAPSVWATHPSGWMIAIFGLILVIAGVFAKAVKI